MKVMSNRLTTLTVPLLYAGMPGAGQHEGRRQDCMSGMHVTQRRAPRWGYEGPDSRNSKDPSYLIVPEKPTTGPLASKEPRAHGAGSKLWEPLVPGCLALIFLKLSWRDN